uniref:SREBP regulating gene protein n=1 Tax=Haptolina ericina TaxID=156174 RepID=A0A7S3ATE4_9EUKA
MAALPAYVAVCATLVLASWTDAYAARAWCRVELLMSYAFVTEGRSMLALPEGFVDEEQPAVDAQEDTLLDPAEGLLTNPSDKAVIASLRGVAERSTAFSCWRNCVKDTTGDCFGCCLVNVCCCGQWCGVMALSTSRTVRPGASKVKRLTPRAAAIPDVSTAVPVPASMHRSSMESALLEQGSRERVV